MTKDDTSPASDYDRHGLPRKKFCDASGFCESTYDTLPSELKPKSILIGAAGSKKPKRINIESPREYHERIAALQARQREAA